MKLTDTKLRSLTKPGKYFDGAGLYLELTAAGGRYWRFKYRIDGREKRLALGVYPTVSLKEAREKLAAARDAMMAGQDPGELRKAAKAKAVHEAANSLEAVSREWLVHKSGKWDPVTLARITASLEADIFPKLGARPMASLKARDVRDAVKAIETRGAADQAGRVLQRVKAIYRYAVTHELIESNPMLDLMPAEILKPRHVQHRPALADKDLPEFLLKLANYDGDPHTKLALRTLILTAVRPGEVRGALWAEMDLDGALWRIPAERMKMRQEHLVPLST
ncbi:MAG: tyrosine-type recombinase/integrase, partial [Ramlibacter sp.]